MEPNSTSCTMTETPVPNAHRVGRYNVFWSQIDGFMLASTCVLSLLAGTPFRCASAG